MNATKFCQLVEARLGWAPPQGPAFKRYRPEASKVLKRQATDPILYSFDNLALAVEFLARERRTRSPLGVFAYVQPALEVAKIPETDLESEISAAMSREAHRGDPDNWVERLARAVGPYRREVLIEWKAQS